MTAVWLADCPKKSSSILSYGKLTGKIKLLCDEENSKYQEPLVENQFKTARQK
jgi:hypothetical protein